MQGASEVTSPMSLSGHASQREANDGMNFVASRPMSILASRYASHAFADKRKTPPLQSADMLAWLMANWFTRMKNKGFTSPDSPDFSLMRKDLRALARSESQSQRLSLRLWDGKTLTERFKQGEQEFSNP